MELAVETKTGFATQYSLTSTPLLDVMKPLPRSSRNNLSVSEYCFLSSIIILALIEWPALWQLSQYLTDNSVSFAVFCSVFLGIPALGLFAAAASHELGRLAAAVSCGFRVVLLKIGPVRMGRRAEDPELHSGDVLPLGIFVLEPRRSDHLRRRLLLLSASGFFGNALLAFFVEGIADIMPLGFVMQFSLHTAAAISVLYGLASLLPDVDRKGNFSDGARIIMLLKDDERAQRWMATIELQTAFNRGEHPRRWAEDLVIRAVTHVDETHDTVVAQWLAYLWAAQRQDIAMATRHLEEALGAMVPATAGLRDRMFVEAAIFQAWFRDNPAKARVWVKQIRESRLTPLQRARLATAQLWAEGKLFDAWEKFEEYFQLLEKLPPSPARNLAENSAREWKKQMESRMLTRAWRTMYSLSQEVASAQKAETISQ